MNIIRFFSTTFFTSIGSIRHSLQRFNKNRVTTFLTIDYFKHITKYTIPALVFLFCFYPDTTSAVWFDSNWDYKVKIEVVPSQVGATSTITSFPVYVNLNNLPSDFHTNVKGDGCDIRMVESDDATETAFELVSYATSTDTGELHFMADALATTSTSTFYMYYGNSAASCYATTDTYGRNNVWGGYVGVWHGNEASGNILSATGNNTGTDTNTVGSATGKLGNGRNFVRSSSEYFVTTNANQTGLGITGNAITLSCWAKGDSTLSGLVIGRMIWRLGGTGSYGYQLSTSGTFYTPNNAYAVSAVGTGGGTDFAFGTVGDATDGVFKHIVATYDGTNFRGYVNANKSTSASAANRLTNANAISFYIGSDPSNFYDDVLDECRVASNVKSDSWVTTEYNNQSSPTTFYWIGSQETESVSGGTVFDGGLIWFD